MKELLKNWDFFRLFRLASGLFGLIVGIMESSVLLVVLGIFLLVQAFLNTSCCCGSNCSIDNGGAKNENKAPFLRDKNE